MPVLSDISTSLCSRLLSQQNKISSSFLDHETIISTGKLQFRSCLLKAVCGEGHTALSNCRVKQVMPQETSGCREGKRGWGRAKGHREVIYVEELVVVLTVLLELYLEYPQIAAYGAMSVSIILFLFFFWLWFLLVLLFYCLFIYYIRIGSYSQQRDLLVFSSLSFFHCLAPNTVHS